MHDEPGSTRLLLPTVWLMPKNFSKPIVWHTPGSSCRYGSSPHSEGSCLPVFRGSPSFWLSCLYPADVGVFGKLVCWVVFLSSSLAENREFNRTDFNRLCSPRANIPQAHSRSDRAGRRRSCESIRHLEYKKRAEAALNYRHCFRILGNWDVSNLSSQTADSQPWHELFTHLFIDSLSSPGKQIWSVPIFLRIKARLDFANLC